MYSIDKVSQTFCLLFEDALEASELEVQTARCRREMGNPPGKINDPLGDQVSWEQFKNCSRNSDNIWIITKDLDYYTVFQNRRYLNALLHHELITTNFNKPLIFCFESLAEGLRHFNENSSEKLEKLPTEDELTIITKEELSDSTIQTEGRSFFPIIEQGRITYMDLPPEFKSPNSYIQYLRSFDIEEKQ